LRKNCIICGKEFDTNLLWQICCNKECSKKYSLIQQRKKYNEKEKKCLIKHCINCGKEFNTSKLHQNKCSQLCVDEYEVKRLKNAGYYKKKKLEKKQCRICNKLFITNKSYKWTCSENCQKIYQDNYKIDWFNKNKVRINEYLRKKKNILWHTDKKYREQVKLCTGIRNRIAKYGWTKQSKVYELLGCTFDEFNKYIEDKFKPGMNWENHGLKGWHADHIKPLASFDLSKKEEQIKAFHYTNYQPLWWYENLKKGSKY
jgi:predicted nucleic acid-binding Zn ribbon protein